MALEDRSLGGDSGDLNDDGQPDASLASTFHFPGYGLYGVGQPFIHPDFSSFANPSVHDDLALLRLGTPLPTGIEYPDIGSFIGAGEEVFHVCFGRSGFGDYGCTTNSTLTDRRLGERREFHHLLSPRERRRWLGYCWDQHVHGRFLASASGTRAAEF